MSVRLSRSDRAIIAAVERGYTATAEGGVVSPRGKVMTLRRRADGYLSFTPPTLRGEKAITVLAHRFVAYFFYGPAVFSQRLIRHLNDDKTDNRPINLAPGSHSDNRADVPREVIVAAGRKAGALATERLRKLSDDQIAAMRRLRAETGASFRTIGQRFGVAAMTAHRCVTGRSWKDIAA